MQPRFGLPQFQDQRRDPPPMALLSARLLQVLRRKKPTKWFWCDMTDLFGEWVPNEWIAACFGVMAATPQHTHQILTKRAARLLEWFRWISDEPRRRCDLAAKSVLSDGKIPLGFDVVPWPLQNVHLGVSVEDQQRADERIPDLLACPAAVHWVSAEPLLGPVDLQPFRFRGPVGHCRGCDCKRFAYEPGEHPGICSCNHDDGAHRPHIGWVVAGGESGRRAREMDVEWVRKIIDWGKFADVPIFVKQMGAKAFDSLGQWAPDGRIPSHGVPFEQWDPLVAVREFPR
jgi:protein gp37